MPQHQFYKKLHEGFKVSTQSPERHRDGRLQFFWKWNWEKSAIVSMKTKLPFHMCINSKVLCQNTQNDFSSTSHALLDSPQSIFPSILATNHTYNLNVICYAFRVQQSYTVFPLVLQDWQRFRKPSTVSNLIHRVTEDHNLSHIGQLVQTPVPGRKALAFVWPPHISPSLSISCCLSPLCYKCIPHLTELLPSC